MATTAPLVTGLDIFPKAAAMAVLKAELLNIAQDEAQIRGIPFPASTSAMKTAVPLDSLSVVNALCELDSVVGFQLKENIVQMGGYDCVEEALNNMIPKIERAWNRKKGPKK